MFNVSNVDPSINSATFLVETPLYEKPVFFRVRAAKNDAIGEWSTPTTEWSLVSDCKHETLYLLADTMDPYLWKCMICPKGTVCKGAVYHEQLVTQQGFSRVEWADPLHDAIRCPFEYACKGGLITSMPSSLCANGTTGPLCAVCKPGYGYQFGRCEECTARNIGMQLLALAVVLILIILILFLARTTLKKYRAVWKDLFGAIKIAIDFLQISSAVPELITITWPPIYYKFLSYFDFVNADFLSLTGASCVSGVNFNLKYFGMSLFPIVAVLYGLLCIHMGRRVWRKKRHPEQQVMEITNNA